MIYKKIVPLLALLIGVNGNGHCYEKNNKGFKMIETEQGIFSVQDKLNKPITLQWEKIKGKTKRLSEKINELAPLFISTYTLAETEFAKKMPQEVPQDFMLKSLAPLLEQGADTVDWKVFEQKVQTIVEQFFTTMDWSAHSDEEETHIFVVAQDQKTKENVAALQFLISPKFEKGSVKSGMFGIAQTAKNREIEQLLMSSIFRIVDEIERIFLHTRCTNQEAIARYKDWGFTQQDGKLPNWIDFEYLSKECNTLQKSIKR